MVKKSIIALVLLIILVPCCMWVVWLCTPNKKFVIAIVDKTVLTQDGQEHISLNWVLNHNKITKTHNKPYSISKDYFGFFPLKNEKYELKGLERFSSYQLSQLSRDAAMVYFTDTYGIYNNEWFKEGNISARSGILYGGLTYQDIELLADMKEGHKLILTEFNTIGSPTQTANRLAFEKMFALKWTGWTGRYFNNLNVDTNLEIPEWLVLNYKKNHNGKWPFKSAGLVFVNNHDEVVVLEEGKDLKTALPYILATVDAQERLGLPKKIKYAFWFDVMKPDLEINKIEASFKLDFLAAGKAKLENNGIPLSFPAIISHLEDYRFYYFSGDFSDNSISLNSSYFKGIGFFKSFFYDDRDPAERSSFFWKFYRPLLHNILKEEIENQSLY